MQGHQRLPKEFLPGKLLQQFNLSRLIQKYPSIRFFNAGKSQAGFWAAVSVRQKQVPEASVSSLFNHHGTVVPQFN